MELDASAIRQALRDFFKFNTQHFAVQGTPVGFNISLLRNRDGDSFTEIPVVDSLDPDSGTRDGGTFVTITGSGFTGAICVLCGGISADFTVVSDTEITFTTPSYYPYTNDSIEVQVRVFNDKGVSVATFNSIYTYT